MNAHTPSSAVEAFEELAISFENSAVLRRMADAGRPLATVDELAKEFGRDPSNFRKSLKRMEGEGTIVRRPDAEGFPWELTDKAAKVLNAVAVAEGAEPAAAEAPKGRWPLDRIQRNPNQPRKRFNDGETAALADTIEAAGDLLQNMVLRPADASGVRMIEAGERRWRACLLLQEQGRLPAALADGVPYVEREGDEADGAFIALVENGPRIALTPWEDAKALAKVADAYNWSGRELARRTGRVTDGSETGVRDVQEKLKVVREAKPEDIARHEAGEDGYTWEWLRGTVRRAADQVSKLDALPPRARLALIELADKVSQEPYGVAEDLETLVGPTYPDPSGTAQALISASAMAISYRSGEPPLAVIFDDAVAWLRKNALLTSEGDRDAILRSARVDATQAARERVVLHGGYATAWLNLSGSGADDDDDADDTAPMETRAKAGKEPVEPESLALTGSQVRALVELRHKVQTSGEAIERENGTFVPVGQYWRDQLASDLSHAHLTLHWHQPGGSPHAAISPQGAEWLEANGYGGAVTEALLDQVRGASGQAGWPYPDRYVTDWLNPEPQEADQTEDAADATPPTATDAEDPEYEEAARQALAAVAEGLAHSGPVAYATLFKAVDLHAPFEAPGGDGAGSVIGADGREIATVDQHRELPDDLAHARALVIAALLNQAAGDA